jgi:dihydrodipicolinate synthase/N-acetylneuraminate lyase
METVAEEIERHERATGKSIVRIAGVCGPAGQAAKEAAAARALGYDAVLLSPGGLGGLTEDEMIDRTKAVASVMPVIAFYLQPAAGGRVFTYSYWERVFEVENVVAVKAASFNRYQTSELVRAVAFSPRAEQITLYTGNDDNIVVDLLTKYRFAKDGKIMGKRFAGGLLGHWSVWTHRVVKLFEQIKRAAESEAIPAELLTLAAEVTDANSAVFDTAHGFAGCIPGVHEVLRRQGLLEGTWCLNPEEALSPGQAEEIERVCRMYPHLSDDEFVAQHLREWTVGL